MCRLFGREGHILGRRIICLDVVWAVLALRVSLDWANTEAYDLLFLWARFCVLYPRRNMPHWISERGNVETVKQTDF